MHCEVKTIREAAPRIAKPLLTIPDWHSSAGRNRTERLELTKRQCAHISDLFREVLFKYRDCGETRLVMFRADWGYLPLTAEELMGWLGRFYHLDGWYEVEQSQRLYAFLIGPESTLQFAN